MKKQSRKAHTFVRHPQSHSNDQTNLMQGQQTNQGYSMISSAVLSNSKTNSMGNLGKIMPKNDNKYEKKEKSGGTGIHSRVKSYGGLFMKSSRHIHQKHTQSSLVHNQKVKDQRDVVYRPGECVISNEEMAVENIKSRVEIKTKIQNPFLKSLDCYVAILSKQKKPERMDKMNLVRKSALKHNKTAQIQDQANAQFKFKIQSLVKENINLKKKVRKIQDKASLRLEQAQQQKQILSHQIGRKRERIRELEGFFDRMCVKFHSMAKIPQKDYIVDRSSNIQPLHSRKTPKHSGWDEQDTCDNCLKKSSSQKTRPRSKFLQVQSLQESRLHQNYGDAENIAQRIAKCLQQKQPWDSDDSDSSIN